MGHDLARFARIVSCLVLGVPSLATADSLSLARVLDAVRSHNPAIAGAQARAVAAASIPARTRAYDDPVVSWEAWNFPEPVAIDRADNNIFRLSQRIPFPGKRTLAGEMAEREAEAVRHDAGEVALDAVTVAKRAYADLWRSHQTLAVSRRDFGLTERVARLVEQRYATGGASQADVLRAQVEVAHVAGELRTAELAIDDAAAGLNAVMSEPPDAALGVPDDPPAPALPPSASELIERALQERPEVAARDATVARESTGERLAEKGLLPDFEVSVGRFVNHDASNGFGAMASMTVPLAWKGKYDAGVAEAKARVLSAEADRRRTTDGIRRDVQQAYLRAKTALVQHDLFAGTHLPHAEQALHVTEAAYVTGESDLTTLLETVRNIERVHLEHVMAAADFEKAYADLERAVGAELPRPAAPHAAMRRSHP
jgi:cobalt-zinc-cadmium efflux system outer membrane protein